MNFYSLQFFDNSRKLHWSSVAYQQAETNVQAKKHGKLLIFVVGELLLKDVINFDYW